MTLLTGNTPRATHAADSPARHSHSAGSGRMTVLSGAVGYRLLAAAGASALLWAVVGWALR
ncbi:MAG TPA: hypothetical protein PL143_09665 [Rhodocyclaceae bacterium]|nr:hypothetical protein [Rhodocyclaceae bacterium]